MASTKTSHVPTGLHFATRMVAATSGFWKSLGNMESLALRNDIEAQEIAEPVFIAGLARSGSTILTEVISGHPQFASHHYSDFPITWTPYWWNYLRDRLPLPLQEPQERAHRDRLMITPDSPEAIEEVLWMHFFPTAHEAGQDQVVGAQESHPRFEAYYRNHIRKLLMIRGRDRYLAKNNYHVTRLDYLLKLFPDARFVIPIRDPVHHVASLIKQHRLFSQQDAEDSRVSRQLQLSGHFEFGPLRRPILVEDNRQVTYGSGLDDVAWYANQWADVYGFLKKRLHENHALEEACLVVPYEKLCSQTGASLSGLFAHVGLDDHWTDQIIATHEQTISAPDYYQPDLSERQHALIREITGDISASYGYD